MNDEEPLHIVHLVCTQAFAGVERYLSYTAPALQGLGHRITVVGGDPTAMSRALDGTGVRFVPAGDLRRSVRVLVSTDLRRRPPDLVHAHMTQAELVAVGTKPVIRRPVVATLHFAHRRGGSPLRRAAWSQIPRFLDGQFAISTAVARASGQRCTVVPSGVPVPPLRYNVARQPVVLVAQRFEPEKDTRSAIGIWAASGLADRGWTMQLAGSGSEEDLLRREARDRGVQASVRFLGFVDDLGARLDSASAFLATTPNDGLGLSVIEAMSHGLPVIAAAGGGYREVLEPVGSSHLFTPGDLDDGGRRLRDLCLDPAELSGYGARARRRFLAEYTVDHHARRLVEAYRTVLASRRTHDHRTTAEKPDRGAT